MRRAAQYHADEDPQGSGQVAELGGQHGANQRAGTRDRSEVVTEDDPTVGLHEFPAIFMAFAGRGPTVVEGQGLGGDPARVETVSDGVGAQSRDQDISRTHRFLTPGRQDDVGEGPQPGHKGPDQSAPKGMHGWMMPKSPAPLLRKPAGKLRLESGLEPSSLWPMIPRTRFVIGFLMWAWVMVVSVRAQLRVGLFDIDATPPMGSRMAYDPVTNAWDLGLRARGVVVMGIDRPVVLCAVDWIGIGNEGHDAFRQQLAAAAGTTVDRVAVHSLHQHDAPECDFGAEAILREAGVSPWNYEGTFARELLGRLSNAVSRAALQARPFNQVGTGQAEVREVASNRRIFGPDGKVRAVRYTATTDPALRAEPEGVIDPMVSLVSFWNDDRPVAVLSYYATHPQSYYRTGVANPDFPGIARFLRQIAVPEALHVHFNGAGGNIGAGKYNDGAPANRRILGERLADGMRRAWDATRREPVTTNDLRWRFEPVALPLSRHLDEDRLVAQLKGREASFLTANGAGRLAWLRRSKSGHRIDIGCLALGRARILHMPGELFVEYQLAAKAERKDLFVAMAAYGDYGPYYIGTTVAYTEGGYETEPRSSNVAPEVEPILMSAVRKLLKD